MREREREKERERERATEATIRESTCDDMPRTVDSFTILSTFHQSQTSDRPRDDSLCTRRFAL